MAKNPNKKFVTMPEIVEAKEKLARQAARKKDLDCEVAGFDEIFD